MNRTLIAALLALCLLTGCAAVEQTTGQPAEQPTETNTSAVADASQMTTVQDVVEDGMVPVPTAELKDGVYPVAVDCSSSMFKIEGCELTVADGAMTAKLTMGSDAYGYFYAGTAEEAAASDGADYIEPENRTFRLDVEALDAAVNCAAWSVKKELWYDRTLVFRADSLPMTAFKTLVTAESLGLADGPYVCGVSLAGGSGRASLQDPARLTVENGAVAAQIVWNSPNYDYMIVDGVRYDVESVTEDASSFTIPVAAFDRALAVAADTTAMSQPHEIEYTLTFDSATLERDQ